MQSDLLDHLLDRLDELKSRFGSSEATRKTKLLSRLSRQRFTQPYQLIRFHEALLFIRAFPDDDTTLTLADRLLATIPERVKKLSRGDVDLSEFDDEAVSGIAGTTVTAAFSFEIARWLADRFPADVSIDWDSHRRTERLGATLPRFLPLLSEDSLVEANVPYLEWLRAGRGRVGALQWILKRFAALPRSEKEKAELYDSLEIPVHWELEVSQATRTGMVRRMRAPFYHTTPLIRRNQVSIAEELTAEPLPVERLTAAQGQAVLDLSREASTLRYRELYGFTYGDPRSVVKVQAGRGVEIFVSGLPPARRLPLRAYHAGLIFKNGVPIGYVETLTLFERSEVGFNLYYTFREGESAWLYAKVLKLLNQLLGATCFSVDPYQIGYKNEEAIESGAFWFYRKLGFRPTDPKVQRLTEAEERKIATRPGYRSPPAALRRLALQPMIYEGMNHEIKETGEWDRFQVRNVGFAVQRRMAARYKGDSTEIRRASVDSVARAIGLQYRNLNPARRQAFEDLALVLALIPNLNRWSPEEKGLLHRVILAKAGPVESRYVRLMQSHERLRRSLLKIGTAG